jgi:hypothetical protein
MTRKKVSPLPPKIAPPPPPFQAPPPLHQPPTRTVRVSHDVLDRAEAHRKRLEERTGGVAVELTAVIDTLLRDALGRVEVTS